ncbi:MAG: 50S ribosomal protein L17 [Candidatus Andersenbacteria bacterium]
MRHKHSNRILGRNSHNRKQLMQNLTSSLLRHGAIVTTEAKAKELRKHVEPLITRAKLEMTLANRRLLTSRLLHKEDLDTLAEIAKANSKRAGGYLRLTHLPVTRADSAPQMRVELIDKN